LPKRAKLDAVPAKLLDGKTVGIFGIGLIAEALAPKCKAFNMTVVGFSSTLREVPGIDRMYLRGELAARASELDYLVLLAPYGDDTRRLIDARVFAAMKPTSYSRQPRARRNCRRRRVDGGAGHRPDCRSGARRVQHEPLPRDHPLWTTRNVIITPHQGGFCDVYPNLAMPTIAHNMECFCAATSTVW